jgi:hypothetical protein
MMNKILDLALIDLLVVEEVKDLVPDRIHNLEQVYHQEIEEPQVVVDLALLMLPEILDVDLKKTLTANLM